MRHPTLTIESKHQRFRAPGSTLTLGGLLFLLFLIFPQRGQAQDGGFPLPDPHQELVLEQTQSQSSEPELVRFVTASPLPRRQVVSAAKAKTRIARIELRNPDTKLWETDRLLSDRFLDPSQVSSIWYAGRAGEGVLSFGQVQAATGGRYYTFYLDTVQSIPPPIPGPGCIDIQRLNLEAPTLIPVPLDSWGPNVEVMLLAWDNGNALRTARLFSLNFGKSVGVPCFNALQLDASLPLSEHYLGAAVFDSKAYGGEGALLLAGGFTAPTQAGAPLFPSGSLHLIHRSGRVEDLSDLLPSPGVARSVTIHDGAAMVLLDPSPQSSVETAHNKLIALRFDSTTQTYQLDAAQTQRPLVLDQSSGLVSKRLPTLGPLAELWFPPTGTTPTLVGGLLLEGPAPTNFSAGELSFDPPPAGSYSLQEAEFAVASFQLFGVGLTSPILSLKQNFGPQTQRFTLLINGQADNSDTQWELIAQPSSSFKGDTDPAFGDPILRNSNKPRQFQINFNPTEANDTELQLSLSLKASEVQGPLKVFDVKLPLTIEQAPTLYNGFGCSSADAASAAPPPEAWPLLATLLFLALTLFSFGRRSPDAGQAKRATHPASASSPPPSPHRSALGLLLFLFFAGTTTIATAETSDQVAPPDATPPPTVTVAPTVTKADPPKAPLGKPKLVFLGTKTGRGEGSVGASTGQALSSYTETLINESQGYELVTLKQIRTLVGFDVQRRLAGCSDESCLSDLSGNLAADRLLQLELSRLGKSLVLGITLLDATEGTQVASEGMRLEQKADAEAVLDLLPELLNKLFKKDPFFKGRRIKARTFNVHNSRRVRRWSFGLQGTVDLVNHPPGSTLIGFRAAYRGGHLGAALTLMPRLAPMQKGHSKQPLGVVLDTHLRLFDAGPVHPFLLLGATWFPPGDIILAHGGLAADLDLFRFLRATVGVNYERLFDNTSGFALNYLLLTLGLSYTP